MKKRSIALFICCLMALLPAATAGAAQFALMDQTQLVYDLTDTLSDEQLLALSTLAKELSAERTIDFAALISDDMQGQDPQEYAQQFFNTTGLGQSDWQDGMILLLNMENRNVVLSGFGICGSIFTTERVDALMDTVEQAMAAQTDAPLYDAIEVYLRQAAQTVDDSMKTSPPPAEPEPEPNALMKLWQNTGVRNAIIAVVFVILAVLLIWRLPMDKKEQQRMRQRTEQRRANKKRRS